MCAIRKINPLKLKNDLIGRLSEKQLNAKMIYREGCAKRPKSLVLTVHWYLIEDIPWIGSLIDFKVKLYFFLISNFPHIIISFSGQSAVIWLFLGIISIALSIFYVMVSLNPDSTIPINILVCCWVVNNTYSARLEGCWVLIIFIIGWRRGKLGTSKYTKSNKVFVHVAA